MVLNGSLISRNVHWHLLLLPHMLKGDAHPTSGVSAESSRSAGTALSERGRLWGFLRVTGRALNRLETPLSSPCLLGHPSLSSHSRCQLRSHLHLLFLKSFCEAVCKCSRLLAWFLSIFVSVCVYTHTITLLQHSFGEARGKELRAAADQRKGTAIKLLAC